MPLARTEKWALSLAVTVGFAALLPIAGELVEVTTEVARGHHPREYRDRIGCRVVARRKPPLTVYVPGGRSTKPSIRRIVPARPRDRIAEPHDRPVQVLAGLLLLTKPLRCPLVGAVFQVMRGVATGCANMGGEIGS